MNGKKCKTQVSKSLWMAVQFKGENIQEIKDFVKEKRIISFEKREDGSIVFTYKGTSHSRKIMYFSDWLINLGDNDYEVVSDKDYNELYKGLAKKNVRK